MHPTDAMFYWAKIYPQRLAILLPTMAITYQAMAEAIAAASERIERLELNRSEPVAVAIDDPAKLIAVCHALVRNGIACAPILRTMLPHLQSHNINTLIFSGVSDIIIGGRNIRFDDSWLQPGSTARPAAVTTPNDSSRYGALIFFTS